MQFKIHLVTFIVIGWCAMCNFYLMITISQEAKHVHYFYYAVHLKYTVQLQ